MKKNRESRGPAVSAETLSRARAGDRDALEQIYEATSLEVFRTARSMVRDEQTALDIQQETYVRAFTHLDQLQEAEKLLPWLRKIALNEVRAFYRGQKTVLFTELSRAEVEEEVSAPAEQTSPELALDRKETSRLVRALLDDLPDGQRLLIGMFYYQQMPVKEIAESLGISVGAVKSQLHHGRKNVEKKVRELEKEGVKLYGLPPLPFAVALLRQLTPLRASQRQVLAGALERAGTSAVLQTGLPFFQTALGRVVLGLGLAAAIGGGFAAGRRLNAHRIVPPDVPTAENVMYLPTEDPSLPTEDPTAPAFPTETDLPAEPTDKAAANTDPTGPAEPTRQEPAVPETEPADAGAAVPDAPDGPVNGGEEDSPAFLGWSWLDLAPGSEMDRSDLTPLLSTGLFVTVRGELAPTLTTDNPGAVAFRPADNPFHHEDLPDEVTDGAAMYYWSVEYRGGGAAQIYCVLDGKTVAALSLDNPFFPPTLTSVDAFPWQPDGDVVSDAVIGDVIQFDLQANYTTLQFQDRYLYPELTTDRPDLLRVSDPLCGTGRNAYGTSSHYEVEIVGSGTARLMVGLAGEIVRTCTVVVPERPTPLERLSWEGQDGNERHTVGGLYSLYLRTEGMTAAEVYTDHPEILDVSVNGSSWCNHNRFLWRITVRALSPGEATVYCAYEGNVVFAQPITVEDP